MDGRKENPCSANSLSGNSGSVATTNVISRMCAEKTRILKGQENISCFYFHPCIVICLDGMCLTRLYVRFIKCLLSLEKNNSVKNISIVNHDHVSVIFRPLLKLSWSRLFCYIVIFSKVWQSEREILMTLICEMFRCIVCRQWAPFNTSTNVALFFIYC